MKVQYSHLVTATSDVLYPPSGYLTPPSLLDGGIGEALSRKEKRRYTDGWTVEMPEVTGLQRRLCYLGER